MLVPWASRAAFLVELQVVLPAAFSAASSAARAPQPPPPKATPSRIRVGGNVQAATLLRQIMPVYPPIAKTAHISGTVVLHAIIAKDGTVQELQYVSGPPLLMKSAMDAVKQWRYKPTSSTAIRWKWTRRFLLSLH